MRIKVTGYLNTEDMQPEHVDLSHAYGLSDEGYTYWATEMALDDVDFKLVGDDDDEAPTRGPRKN